MVSDAIDSFTYAFRPSLLVLYLTVLVGETLGSVQIPFRIESELLRSAVHLPFRLGGLVLVVVGVVAILHRVVTDATAGTEAA